MSEHSPRRSNLSHINGGHHAVASSMGQWINAWMSLGLPSRWREGRGDGWCSDVVISSVLDHAGNLNASPLVSTAQAMRAFLAAMATTAFQ
jgi:hypothetical protein